MYIDCISVSLACGLEPWHGVGVSPAAGQAHRDHPPGQRGPAQRRHQEHAPQHCQRFPQHRQAVLIIDYILTVYIQNQKRNKS